MSVEVRLTGTPPPQFNSAQGVFGEIQGELGTLQGLWGTLSSLLADLQREQAAKPEPPNTTGMKEEDAKKAMADFDTKSKTWSDNVAQIQGRIQETQQKIEQSQQKLANLQGTKLPAAQCKDRNDMDRWMEDQKKAQEALTAGAQGSGFDRSVGGHENGDILRQLLAQVALKQMEVGNRLHTHNMHAINTGARTEVRNTIGRTPPRNDGLTIG